MPIVRIREFDKILPSLIALSKEEVLSPDNYELLPSIAYNGDLVLLAPEFLNTRAPHYQNFVVGNVIRDGFSATIKKGLEALYVADFMKGLVRCKEECGYFATCQGGQPGNKFAELGTLAGTETTFCKNVEKLLVDAILCELNSQKKGGKP